MNNYEKYKEFYFDNEDVYLYLGELVNNHDNQIKVYHDFIELSMYINNDFVLHVDVPGFFSIFGDSIKHEFYLDAVNDKLNLLRFCKFEGRIVYEMKYGDDCYSPHLYIIPYSKFDVDIVDENEWIDMDCRILLDDN